MKARLESKLCFQLKTKDKFTKNNLQRTTIHYNLNEQHWNKIVLDGSNV